ncbi:hypothetical protein ADIARSV_0867 [Arcticibacter svalbardensis MN12-7]|uniref:Uncharacterized protein n=1 Tax=Arcticibacter svalbardensis MN12-7 TaxID=1150600 RepID=R9GVW0_9SPHI|nr:hypothetical protein ADIARSV_0867 [Arcticibacter svalbardensis MN12-7]
MIQGTAGSVIKNLDYTTKPSWLYNSQLGFVNFLLRRRTC